MATTGAGAAATIERADGDAPSGPAARSAWWLAAPPLVFLALFLAFPLLELVSLAFCGHDAWPALTRALRGEGPCAGGLTAAWRTLSRESVRGRFAFTVLEATLSTVITLALALPAAHFFARRHFRGKAVLRALVTVPFVLPAVVVALAFLALVGPRGLVPLDLPPLFLILLAHAFYNYAVVVRLVGGVWARLDPRYAEAAATLGLTPFRAFLRTELPLLAPAIAAASVLVFVFSFTSFGIILIVAGPAYATVEVAIYEAVRLLRLEHAAALALVQLVFTFIAMALYARLQERTSVPVSVVAEPAAGGAGASTPGNRWSASGIGGALAVAAGLALVLLPVLALVTQSFRGADGWTLAHYRNLGENVHGVAFFTTPREAAANSLRFAAATAAIALPMGLLSALAIHGRGRGRGTLLDALLMVPLGVSAVTLGVGFMRAFNAPPLDLRASPVLIVLAHALIAYPFTTRAVLAGARAIPPRLLEAAATLGAAPFARFRRVLLPLLMPGLIVGAVFAFAVSLGEFAATTVVARPEHHTLPLLVYRELSRPDPASLGKALALATLLMGVTASLFVILERFRWKNLGEF